MVSDRLKIRFPFEEVSPESFDGQIMSPCTGAVALPVHL